MRRHVHVEFFRSTSLNLHNHTQPLTSPPPPPPQAPRPCLRGSLLLGRRRRLGCRGRVCPDDARDIDVDPNLPNPVSSTFESLPFRGDRGQMAARLGPAPDLSDSGPARGARHLEAKGLRPRHVPLPERGGFARRPPGGLHRDGHRRARGEDEGAQRAPPDRLGRVRASGGAVRDPDGDAPGGDDGERGRSGVVVGGWWGIGFWVFFYYFFRGWVGREALGEKGGSSKISLYFFFCCCCAFKKMLLNPGE